MCEVRKKPGRNQNRDKKKSGGRSEGEKKVGETWRRLCQRFPLRRRVISPSPPVSFFLLLHESSLSGLVLRCVALHDDIFRLGWWVMCNYLVQLPPPKARSHYSRLKTTTRRKVEFEIVLNELEPIIMEYRAPYEMTDTQRPITKWGGATSSPP